MTRYATYTKLRARPGQRRALVENLVALAEAVSHDDACLVYLIYESVDDEDEVVATTIWTTEEAHEAGSRVPEVARIAQQAAPLLDGRPEQFRLNPVGGTGVPPQSIGALDDVRPAGWQGSFQVGIVVGDLGSMVDFYQGVLGLAYLDDLELAEGLMKRFVVGDACLKLLAPHETPTPTAPGGPVGGVAGLRYLTVEVDDVLDTVERCMAAGRAVPMPPFELEPGHHLAVVEDPEGNWVELVKRR